ncbi:hypothetical protein FACS1894208_04930 [Clostridia bacterium]|nr:hypothetical protein FACS1894208_04930 [Clostridia bacterium]
MFGKLEYRHAQKTVPTDALTVCFGVSADGYGGGVRAVYEAMLADEKYSLYNFVWGVPETDVRDYLFLRENPRTRIVKIGSEHHLRALVRAKYWFSDGNFGIKAKKDQVLTCTKDSNPNELLEKVIDLKEVRTEAAKKAIERRERGYERYAKFMGIFRGLGIYTSENARKLASYRDKHKGQRCFLIGNGPSLTVSDLNKLRGEITFGCNMITKIFDMTDWRPNYYFLLEWPVMAQVKDEIADCEVFFSRQGYLKLKEHDMLPPKYVYANQIFPRDKYWVTDNLFKYFITSRATVMTYIIETAMYMGFSEIYLIGVDNTNPFISGSHFSPSYRDEKLQYRENLKAVRTAGQFKDALEIQGKVTKANADYAYGKLREYAEKRGVRIYNATRGGELEAFERVNLDEVVA